MKVTALLACSVLLCLPYAVRAEGAPDAIFARVRAADLDGALKLIAALPAGEAAQTELRYLAARLHEKRGRLEEALAALPADLQGLPEAVVADARQRRALWLSRTGQCKEAKPLLLALVEDAPDTKLTLAAAECALGEGDAALVLSLLQKLPAAAEQSVPARLLRARALIAKRERKAAIELLRDICLRSPANARSAEAQRMLEKLVPKLQWTDDERLQRAASFLDALRPLDGIAELDRMHAPKAKPVRARALHVRGMALFQMRTRYAEAAKVLDLAAKQGGPDAPSDAYHAARALARADRDAEAVKAFRAFAKRYPDSTFVAEAMHTAAWLELRHGMPGGEAHMRAHLADIEKKDDREALQSALWELGFYLFDQKRFDQAQPLFERYAATSQVSMVRARGFYWAGRAAQLAGHRDDAIARFRDAFTVEPLHWYQLLARERLLQLAESVGAPFDSAKVATTTPPAALAPPAPEGTPEDSPGPLPLPAAVAFYARLGLNDDALTALRDSEDALRKLVTQGDALLALLATYRALGEHARPYRLVERERMGVMEMQPDPRSRPLWDALFPRPYAAEVASASQHEQLPEDFVYSIMRKESAYDPSVVSSADAMGLLQLIEPTARTMARQLGLGSFARAQLFDPSTNIRLGAHYLANLRALYKGQYVPAIAAYNAGEHRVTAWLARAQQRDPQRIELDRFVEDIPIEQTRNYVRRVIANWARYLYLQDPASVASLELPELLHP